MFDLFISYLSNSTAITVIVLVVLSIYLLLTFWIFIYRYFYVDSLINNEKKSLEFLLMQDSASLSTFSSLNKHLKNEELSKERLNAGVVTCIREASVGVSWLSIISSTSPFVGLFGTVVGILESFAKFSLHSKVGFSVIAPAISEALVATAAGIFVAIFAYTFHQMLVRKIYELDTFLKAQTKILASKG